MDARTLSSAMGGKLTAAKYAAYVDDFNRALTAANATTVNRAAMFCAQVGHESLGLYYMEELASGAAYEGRKDLGNTQPGDGKRFKGRGPIQLTGRANYRAFTDWCRRGDANSPDFTVDPTLVATSRWGFLAASWYWTVARPKLNAYSDAGDVLSATKAINGGTNGLTDRQNRWNACLRLGTALLPSGSAPPAPSTARRTLRRGDNGADVRDLQTVLARWYPALKVVIDGDFGPGTEKAVRELQGRAGLTVDGVAGPATFRALGMS